MERLPGFWVVSFFVSGYNLFPRLVVPVKNSPLFAMIKRLLLLLYIALVAAGCSDDCTQTRTYLASVYTTIDRSSLKNSISTTGAKDFAFPGKIYAYKQYLLIGEAKEGIHIIDNSNPQSPQKVAFVIIPGVIDFAVKDDVLYADNYTDLVALSLANPTNVHEIGRREKVFNYGMWNGRSWNYNPTSGLIADYKFEWRTETFKTNCGNDNPGFWGGIWGTKDAMYNSSGPTGSVGQGGSMARFTIYDQYLYAVTDKDLLVYNIQNPALPDSTNSINLGGGIETIFPYNDKLFIGSNTGMHIYDNANPAKPTKLAVFNHARACDPVVVQGNRAYVTLRSAGWCGAAPNQLHVINIGNLAAPSLIKSYEMQNPHGLSVRGTKLSLAEGQYGLKSFDIANELDIKQLQHLRDHHAFDVIQLAENHLLVVGNDGFYQYDNSNPAGLRLLSKIEVKRPF